MDTAGYFYIQKAVVNNANFSVRDVFVVGWSSCITYKKLVKAGHFYYRLQELVFLRWNIPHYILYIALQDPAKVIDCCCIERLILPELVNSRTGDMVMMNQAIRAFIGCFQGLPKTVINHHIISTPLMVMY